MDTARMGLWQQAFLTARFKFKEYWNLYAIAIICSTFLISPSLMEKKMYVLKTQGTLIVTSRYQLRNTHSTFDSFTPFFTSSIVIVDPVMKNANLLRAKRV